jgi:hypothetical protein
MDYFSVFSAFSVAISFVPPWLCGYESIMQNKANVKMGNINISTAKTKAYANEPRTMNTKRYSKQTQSNPVFLRPKPTQPPVRAVIPTEGTLPVCPSGGICFNILSASQTAYSTQSTKESWPVLCKTNPILLPT